MLGLAKEQDFVIRADHTPGCQVVLGSQTRKLQLWPAAGFVDTVIEGFIKPEVADAAEKIWA